MLGPEKLHPAAEGLSLLVCQGLPEHPPANRLSRPGRKTSILRPVPLWEFCPYLLPLLNASYMEENNLNGVHLDWMVLNLQQSYLLEQQPHFKGRKALG